MTGFWVLVAVPAVAIALAVLYFRFVEVDRPPVGVYTVRDIVVVMAVVVLLPVLYLALPDAAVATVLGLMTVLAVQFTLAPVLTGRVALLVAVAAGGLDVALVAAGATPWWNNVLLLVLVVGVTNLYVQSGIKARDVAVFGVLLAGYDVVATTMLPTMGELLAKTVGLPFAPVFADGARLIGLGDVLMLTLWTLVALKAFGRAAALLAAFTALALTTALALVLDAGVLTGPFPVMLVAGPLMAAQYLLWRALGRTERTSAHRDRPTGAPVPTVEEVARDLTARLDVMNGHRPVAAGQEEGGVR